MQRLRVPKQQTSKLFPTKADQFFAPTGRTVIDGPQFVSELLYGSHGEVQFIEVIVPNFAAGQGNMAVEAFEEPFRVLGLATWTIQRQSLALRYQPDGRLAVRLAI